MPTMRLAFVDLETTGAATNADRITEIGIVDVDTATGTSQEWSSLVNPRSRISEFIERLTGISNAMVADAPDFSVLAPEILRRLEGRIFVAHNARFDYGFLKHEFAQLGIDFRATVLCTVKLSRRLFPQHRKHNLDSLIARHDLAAGARHRALGDARAIAQFWQVLQREVAAETLAAAIKNLTTHASLPPNIDAAQVDSLPDSAGVYLFYGENDLPLYVGKSKTLKKRVLAHFSADQSVAKATDWVPQVRRIEVIQTAGDIGALLTEARLIRQLQPVHNRRGRHNAELCSWRYELDAEGLAAPLLVTVAADDFCRQGREFGLFKTARDAIAALRGLAAAHGLCHGLLGLEKLRPGQACFARQARKCRGACVGAETAQVHAARVVAALVGLRLPPWPFAGPAVLSEGEELHVVEDWRYLGSARDAAELDAVAQAAQPEFDAEIFRVLVKLAARMKPLQGVAATGRRLASAEFCAMGAA